MRVSSSSLSNSGTSGQDQYKSGHEQQNFIQKAYQLVNNPNNSQIIHWSRSGLTFIIEDIERFQRDILPLYFRHNRYQSFVRQLNMYDFHKIRNGDYYCDNKSEFKHEEFCRGNYNSILQIRRKGFQAKTKQKQYKNTKIKKNHRMNTRKTIKRKKVHIPKPKLEKVMSSHSVQSEQNSFFINLPKQGEFCEQSDKMAKKQRIMEKILMSVIERIGKDDMQALYKKNKINFTIELAEQVKNIWLQNFQKIVDAEDIKNMKAIYHKVKQHLTNPNLTTQNPHSSTHLPNEPHFDYLIQQQDAIINSIFRTQIKSTLICITSQTFLTNNHNRKIDTLIGM